MGTHLTERLTLTKTIILYMYMHLYKTGTSKTQVLL